MANEPENRNEQNGEAVKPKKKNIIRLFRPQNSKTGAVKTQRPGAEHHRPRPEGARPVRRRPAGNGSVQEHAAEETRKTVRPEVSASAAAAETEKAAKQIQKAVLSSEKVQEAAAVKEGTAAVKKEETAAAVKKEETAAVKKEEAAGAKAPAGSGVKPVTEKVSAEKAAPAEKPAVQKGTPEKISAEKTVPAGKAAEEKPAAAEKAAADKKAASAGKIADEGKESLVKAGTEKESFAKENPAKEASSEKTASQPAPSAQKSAFAAKNAETSESFDRSQRTDRNTENRNYGDRSASAAGTRRDAGAGTGRGQARRTGQRTGDSARQGVRPGQGRYENQSRPGGGYQNRSSQGGSSYQGNRSGQNSGRTYTDRNGQGSGRSYGDRSTSFGTRAEGSGNGFRRGDSQGQNRYQGGSNDRRNAAGKSSVRGSAAAADKPMEKEGRYRNDRGHVNDRKRNDRTDKFDRMERNGQQNITRSNKNSHKKPQPAAPKVQPEAEKIKSIIIPESLTLKELADKMKVQPAQIIKKLFMQGKMFTINDEIDFETAEEIAIDYDILCEKEVKVAATEELLKDIEDDPKDLKPRPPVVCVMGHVDHGKTSLLDAIRHTHVTDRESGGITQAIGASVVRVGDRTITFLDTPGHEAFTAMRMRGANSTDIAVLVVAADDGVMPQTVEAINHAKAANIEIIVAINKIDKPGANVERVKQELSEYELIPEEWGGSTVFCEVSAKTGQGIDNLLDMILLTADVMELSANPDRRARGLVIEAKLDKGSGPVATVLIQKGTLHTGDPVAAGQFFGKVRLMSDDKHRTVKEAGPSMPVEIVGLNGVPNAGEIIVSPESEKDARNFAQTFITENKERLIADTRKKMSLDDLFSEIKEGELKELNLIIKADVQGSVEALKQSLLKLSNDEVVVKVIHSGVGAINESDVVLASASNAVILGFNVRPDGIAKSTAEHEGVDIHLYKVIYDAINDVERAMKGMLEPVYEEKVIGHAEIRQIFKASGVGSIAGSYVLDGTIERGCKARITRGKDQIFEGNVASLKRFKDDVKIVKAGYECGVVFDGFDAIQEGDTIEAYKMVEVPRQ